MAAPRTTRYEGPHNTDCTDHCSCMDGEGCYHKDGKHFHCAYCHGVPLRTSEGKCTKCGANFQGDPIPVDSQHSFGATHFSRIMGHEIRGEDRISSWSCQDCGHTWPRV